MGRTTCLVIDPNVKPKPVVRVQSLNEEVHRKSPQWSPVSVKMYIVHYTFPKSIFKHQAIAVRLCEAMIDSVEGKQPPDVCRTDLLSMVIKLEWRLMGNS